MLCSRIRRHAGVVAVVLLGVTAATALVLAHQYQLGVAAILVGILGGLPGLYLAWAAISSSPGGAGSLDLATVADQLAATVGEQWQAEAAVRRLNDPYPLPVSWAAGDASLTDSWDSLVKLATSGAGWPTPPPAPPWAAGPEGLAGKDRELVDVLARVPTGRLVVLGEPGAGKTMLMVRLVLDILGRRASGGPVPLLAPVASWDPASQDLRGWLCAQLLIDHPALAEPPPPGRAEPTQAEALLAAGLVLPVLDGLDEIPGQVQGPAISRINNALRPGEQVVVTCRTQQYRDAVRPKGGAEVTLRGAAAIQLRPLDAAAVRGYLRDDAAGPCARGRWEPVLAVLGTDVPAGQALSTPLMVGLARTIYNPRPGELAGILPDPADLCKPDLADRAAVESVLFDAFIPAAYRDDPAGRWKAQDAERWLVFLARHLEQTIGGPDLAWWQLRRAAPRAAFRLAYVLACVLAVGITGALAVSIMGALAGALTTGTVGSGIGLVAGVGFGLVTALVYRLVNRRFGRRKSNAEAPSRGMRVSGSGARLGFAAGLVACVGFGLGLGLRVGPAIGFVVGLGVGLTVGLTVGLATVPVNLAVSASPRAVLARDKRAALLLMLATGAGVGLAVGLTVGLAGGGLMAAFVYGLVTGLIVGLLASGTQTAWPPYLLTRGWLAFNHRLPRSLMSFLTDARQRGVLRQAGAVYQFRHIDLQHRLAARP